MNKKNTSKYRGINIKNHIGLELYESVQPIIIDKDEIRSIKERREFIESFAETIEEYIIVYQINRSIQKIGNELYFHEIGLYDEVYFFYQLNKKNAANILKSLKNIRSLDDYHNMCLNFLDIYF